MQVYQAFSAAHTHIQVHSSKVLYAGKCTRRAGKYNLTKLEDEIREMIYPPSIHCTVRYPLPPDSSMETQEVGLMIKGTSMGQLKFPVKVTEVKGMLQAQYGGLLLWLSVLIN